MEQNVAFIRKNANLPYLDNFETNITGDASLILGLTEQILHPLILTQFSAGPTALIGQKTPTEINTYAFQHIQLTYF